MTLLDGEYSAYTLDLGVQSTLEYLINSLCNPESALQKACAASPTFTKALKWDEKNYFDLVTNLDFQIQSSIEH